MADIFISYASDDRARIAPIVKALEEQGWSLFWDWTSIPVGKTWRKFIKEGLDDAKCVLVLWSEKSITSEWVIEEADHGKINRMLVPDRIDDVRPPIGFGQIQAANLINWTGDIDNHEFERLVEAIVYILGPSPRQAKEKEQAAEEERRQKQEGERKREEEERRKAEEKRRLEQENKRAETERKAEEERKRKETEEQERAQKAEAERKAEEERISKEIKVKRKAVEELKRIQAEEKADRARKAEADNNKNPKNIFLKKGAVVCLLILLIVGTSWFITDLGKDKVRISEQGQNLAEENISNFPTKAVQIIIPYAAGGATDLIFRALLATVCDIANYDPFSDKNWVTHFPPSGF